MDLIDKSRQQTPDIREVFIKAQVDPLCGWPWLDENRRKEYPEQSITVSYNGKPLLAMPSAATKRGLIKAAMTMATRSMVRKER